MRRYYLIFMLFNYIINKIYRNIMIVTYLSHRPPCNLYVLNCFVNLHFDRAHINDRKQSIQDYLFPGYQLLY